MKTEENQSVTLTNSPPYAAASSQTAPSQGRLLGLMLIPTLCIYALYQGIQQILIPVQIEQLDPAAKIENFALLTTLSAIASMLALPSGGALSDRTRSRFGKRTPWLVVSALASAIIMFFMGKADSLPLLATCYVGLWFASNFYQGALTAVLPDRVPADKRGLASSVIGIGTPLGIMLGVNIASRTSADNAYILIGVLVFFSTLLFVIGAREPSSQHLPPVKRSTTVLSRQNLATFFSAFASADFRYAFFSRLMLFMSYFVVSGYMYYTLQDYIGAENLPYPSVSMAVGVLSSINVTAWVIVTLFSGWLADRFNRRKMFVGISAIGVAASMLLPILFPNWYGMLAYSVFSGLFIGIYFAVDLALMSLVLPNKDSEGRDFGILAVATGLPQLASGSISALLIAWLGGYIALYSFGILSALASGLLIFRIKSVK